MDYSSSVLDSWKPCPKYPQLVYYRKKKKEEVYILCKVAAVVVDSGSQPWWGSLSPISPFSPPSPAAGLMQLPGAGKLPAQPGEEKHLP